MKTIDNLNITEITFREYKESYGSGKEYSRRLNLNMEYSINERLKVISNEIGIKPVEIIRQVISVISDKLYEAANENDNKS